MGFNLEALSSEAILSPQMGFCPYWLDFLPKTKLWKLMDIFKQNKLILFFQHYKKVLFAKNSLKNI